MSFFIMLSFLVKNYLLITCDFSICGNSALKEFFFCSRRRIHRDNLRMPISCYGTCLLVIFKGAVNVRCFF